MIKIPKGVFPKVEHTKLPDDIIEFLNKNRIAKLKAAIEKIRPTAPELTWENLPEIIDLISRAHVRPIHGDL